MKFIIGLLVVYLATGFLDAAPTTAAPKVIVINLNNDTRLGELSGATEKITNKLPEIDRTFEMASTLGNRAQLTKLLATIKELRTENNHLHIEITIELATRSNQNAHFLNRLSLEMLRIQVERMDKYFKWVGLEIIGENAGFSTFESYVTSVDLGVAASLIGEKFITVISHAFAVDQMLNEINAKGGSADQATRSQVDGHLQAIISQTAQAKGEILQAYSGAVEAIRLNNHELNLWQKLEFEGFIDILNYMALYVKKFEEIFSQIH